jgi:putative hydrolase of the HAD superfamily
MGGVRRRPPKVALLDALGTLLWLEPPAPALRDELERRLGLRVDGATAEAAIAAEIAYYRAHNLEGGDAERLADLRGRCAEVVSRVLAEAGHGPVPLDGVLDALLGALRFRAFPDAPPALRRLRAAGVRTVVVSNWDVSLHDRLAEVGIAGLVDGAVASAEVGAAKPEPAIFARALQLAGDVAPGDAIHAGDSPREDVEGASRAGIAAVLVARDGASPSSPGGPPVVRDLEDLAGLIGA